VSRALDLGCAAIALLAAHIWLRVAPGRSIRWASADDLRPSARARTCDPLVRAVASIGARLDASCLEQGLALVMLCRAASVPARLVIGVSRPGQTFAAHAWVECGSRVVLGAPQAADFVPLPSVASPPCRG
jgi:hypothetical protein